MGLPLGPPAAYLLCWTRCTLQFLLLLHPLHPSLFGLRASLVLLEVRIELKMFLGNPAQNVCGSFPSQENAHCSRVSPGTGLVLLQGPDRGGWMGRWNGTQLQVDA